MTRHQAHKCSTTGAVALVLGMLCPSETSAQAPQLIVASAPWVGRAAALIGEFLAQYTAGKGVDHLIGDGANLRDALARQRDQLQTQAASNVASRQILLRQAAILDGLRSDLSLLLRQPPAATEAVRIRDRTTQALEVLKSVQAEHDRRIGRLEQGQDSLRRLLGSLMGARSGQPTVSSPGVAMQEATCKERNTGHYGFANPKTVTRLTVILYYREGSAENRTIIVPPGQTQFVYDFPAGARNYLVTYRAQVPIMPFPPGAPTIEQDVIHLRGQIYVEQCKTGTLDMK